MSNSSWISRILGLLLVASIQRNDFMWCPLTTTQVVASTIIKYKMFNSLLVLHFIFCFFLSLCYCFNYTILMFQVFCVFPPLFFVVLVFFVLDFCKCFKLFMHKKLLSSLPSLVSLFFFCELLIFVVLPWLVTLPSSWMLHLHHHCFTFIGLKSIKFDSKLHTVWFNMFFSSFHFMIICNA
jgi:hypothetical protein